MSGLSKLLHKFPTPSSLPGPRFHFIWCGFLLSCFKQVYQCIADIKYTTCKVSKPVILTWVYTCDAISIFKIARYPLLPQFLIWCVFILLIASPGDSFKSGMGCKGYGLKAMTMCSVFLARTWTPSHITVMVWFSFLLYVL